MNFNLKQVPFSRYGSYFAFSLLLDNLNSSSDEQNNLYLRTIHGGMHTLSKEVMQLTVIGKDQQPIPFKIQAAPELMRMETEEGYIEICIAEPKIIRVRGFGAGLRLTRDKKAMFDNAIPTQNHQWIINAFSKKIQLMLVPLRGRLEMKTNWDGTRSSFVQADMLPDQEGGFECAIEEFYSSWHQHPYNDFDESRQKVREEFESFLNKLPAVPAQLRDTYELAAYINWSCIVEPNGLIKRPTMLMSKNWMTNVWSWDHCFNALSLSYKNPELAWDQLMTIFDHQDTKGALPDSVNDQEIIWNFCKPPIHGWALKKMMNNNKYFLDYDKLYQIYQPLCNWTTWWLNYRDDDDDCIPQYNHGNDSGWDNSSVFIDSPPIESPDLTAFIIIQIEVLSDIANKLGRKSESKAWGKRAEQLLAKLLEHSLKNGQLLPLQSGTHKIISSCSLLPFIPIVLAKRLPEEILKGLITGLRENNLITEHGLATESINSPLYESDGYWRGPIWAPSTMLIVDGLKEAGEELLARDISHKFINLCRSSGFAENFDALSGEGLRDRAYTWTSSVFMILTHEYLQ